MNKFELGEFFKELRLARRLKLKDLTCDNLTISQLSKFENGQSMLSGDRMLLAIEGLNMSLEEFGEIWKDRRLESFTEIKTNITNLYATQDIDGLVKLLKKVQSNYKGVYGSMISIVIRVTLNRMDSKYLLEDTDKKLLTSYLYSIESWTSFEIYLFRNTLSILNSSDLVFLGATLVQRAEIYLSLPANNHRFKYTLVCLVDELVQRGKFPQAIYFLECLNKTLSYFDAFEYIFSTYFKLLIDYLTTKHYEEIEKYIDTLKNTGNLSLVEILKLNLKRYAP